MATVNERHYERARTKAQLAAENPTLDREFCIESDTGHFKAGPGAWNSLPYADSGATPELTVSDPGKVPIATSGTAPDEITELDVDNLAYKPITTWLTANSATVNNSATLVNATGLLAPVAATTTYRFQAHIFFNATLTADLKLGWGSPPAGISGRWAIFGIADSAAAADGVLPTAASVPWTSTLNVNGGGAAVNVSALISGTLIVGGTAGTMQLQFAQKTAEVSDVFLQTGSMILFQQVT